MKSLCHWICNKFRGYGTLTEWDACLTSIYFRQTVVAFLATRNSGFYFFAVFALFVFFFCTLGAIRVSVNCSGIFIHFRRLFFSKFYLDQFLPSALFVFYFISQDCFFVSIFRPCYIKQLSPLATIQLNYSPSITQELLGLPHGCSTFCHLFHCTLQLSFPKHLRRSFNP